MAKRAKCIVRAAARVSRCSLLTPQLTQRGLEIGSAGGKAAAAGRQAGQMGLTGQRRKRLIVSQIPGVVLKTPRTKLKALHAG